MNLDMSSTLFLLLSAIWLSGVLRPDPVRFVRARLRRAQPHGFEVLKGILYCEIEKLNKVCYRSTIIRPPEYQEFSHQTPQGAQASRATKLAGGNECGGGMRSNRAIEPCGDS